MGDFFDAQESGALCMGCGVFIGNDYPSYCSSDCKGHFMNPFGSKKKNHKKVKCFECDKMLSPLGVRQHMESKHKAVK